MKYILFKVLQSIRNDNYVIIKLPQNFPKHFKTGSDLDILCKNNDKILKKIKLFANNFFLIKDKNELRIIYINQNHVQVDFYTKKKLLFKLDIFDKFKNFNEINISEKLKNKILNNKIEIKLQNFSNNLKIKIPKKNDETFVRYIEFLKSGKRKKQHKQFFYRFINDEKLKRSFSAYFNKRKIDFEIMFDVFRKYKSQINYYKYKFNKHSLNEILTLIKKKF